MNYSLMEIREYVLKLAEVISEVLRVDVEIVDCNLIRIAGTGRYKNKACVSIQGESFIYRKVLETGKKQVVENPGFHKLCKDCPKKNSCIEKFECCTPIIVENKVIGVISLISFTDMQKKIIIDKFKEYTEFLDKISELIGTKAKEHHYEMEREGIAKQLQSIINYIQDNVVVIDREGYVLYNNHKFSELLKGEFNIEDPKKVQIAISDYGERIIIDDLTQFNLRINHISKKVLGEIKDIHNGETIDRVIIFRDMKRVHKTFYEQTEGKNLLDFNSIIGESKEALKVKSRAKKIAAGHASVMVTGESGTGKELFARAIHNESPRRKGPFIAINCGAIPDTLLESELFGYVPGAFSGASKSGKIGKFELANKGTIFLDEIGDMPLHLQVKLLRVLQEKVVIPIGSNKPVQVDVRVISATNKDLDTMVRNGEFREDLFYRLNVIPIEIPPLRKRTEDIPIMINYFLEKYCRYYSINTPKIAVEAMELLNNYRWQGNVRELENTIEYIVNVIQEGRVVELNHLPPRITEYEKNIEICEDLNIEKVEKQLILKAIREYGSSTEDKKKVAKALGISLATLYRKMEKYNISKSGTNLA